MPALTIDCFVGAFPEYPSDTVVVGVDVIRSTTTAITAVDAGHRCHVVPSLEEAMRLHGLLDEPLLAGELGGNMPFGFDLNNSPAAMAQLPHPERPVVLLSSSGTRLLTLAASRHATTMVACLRNWHATADAIAALGPSSVVLVGAGTRGEFRDEDQICCAWIAGRLVDRGYRVAASTRRVVDRWRDIPAEAIAEGPSARYLRDSGQLADLDFILEHVGDLDATFEMRGSEVIRSTADATGFADG